MIQYALSPLAFCPENGFYINHQSLLPGNEEELSNTSIHGVSQRLKQLTLYFFSLLSSLVVHVVFFRLP